MPFICILSINWIHILIIKNYPWYSFTKCTSPFQTSNNNYFGETNNQLSVNPWFVFIVTCARLFRPRCVKTIFAAVIISKKTFEETKMKTACMYKLKLKAGARMIIIRQRICAFIGFCCHSDAQSQRSNTCVINFNNFH